ncbi:NAD(P)H-dependent oxidoreductase [Hymenobacter sp. DH14]|uniref:NAD(P)H-dependent oxidoreductase n=1 Tax=Hymenobacter cyanobacteriorum TaxID=2926463 RepID=A0A9X1VER8_9BACT|nr:NAD(P)H-dependent oxidoreductase [Hymenobacter cyanobacteriorum]MCI1187576.1 NAD(P)H-dependent oxidoreductase [Hymenobacter cyanobacteriorum]
MSPFERRFLFLLSSPRRLGNSEQLAYCAAHPLPPGTAQKWMHLLDFPLPDFADLRHNGPYHAPIGNAQLLLEATLQATDLVLVAPLYWYSLPAPAKLYLDHWSAWLRTPDLNFRPRMQGKTLWSITVSSGARPEAQPLEDMLKLTAQHLQMHWGGLLYGTGSRPNDIQGDAQALNRAKYFFSAAEAPLVAAETSA